MTVGELIRQLQQVDQERLVVMASDAEGNGHSPLDGFWEGSYRAHNTYAGSVGLERLTAADRRCGYTKDDVVKGEPAIILKPVN